MGAILGAQFPQSVVSIPQKQIWPYVQQWHFDIQHELPAHIVASFPMSAARERIWEQRYDLNQLQPLQLSSESLQAGSTMVASVIAANGQDCLYAGDCQWTPLDREALIPATLPMVYPPHQTPGTPGVNMYVACGNDPDFFRPFLAIPTSGRKKHSLVHLSRSRVVGAENGRRTQISASYTYSHSIDDASSAGIPASSIPTISRTNRASSNFDQRHVFTLSYIYDLPFFKGQD